MYLRFRGEPRVDFATLVRDKSSRDRLRDRFAFVGEASQRDSYETPFGHRSGIWIHAAAANSLRQFLPGLLRLRRIAS